MPTGNIEIREECMPWMQGSRLYSEMSLRLIGWVQRVGRRQEGVQT